VDLTGANSNKLSCSCRGFQEGSSSEGRSDLLRNVAMTPLVTCLTDRECRQIFTICVTSTKFFVPLIPNISVHQIGRVVRVSACLQATF